MHLSTARAESGHDEGKKESKLCTVVRICIEDVVTQKMEEEDEKNVAFVSLACGTNKGK